MAKTYIEASITVQKEKNGKLSLRWDEADYKMLVDRDVIAQLLSYHDLIPQESFFEHDYDVNEPVTFHHRFRADQFVFTLLNVPYTFLGDGKARAFIASPFNHLAVSLLIEATPWQDLVRDPVESPAKDCAQHDEPCYVLRLDEQKQKELNHENQSHPNCVVVNDDVNGIHGRVCQ